MVTSSFMLRDPRLVTYTAPPPAPARICPLPSIVKRPDEAVLNISSEPSNRNKDEAPQALPIVIVTSTPSLLRTTLRQIWLIVMLSLTFSV